VFVASSSIVASFKRSTSARPDSRSRSLAAAIARLLLTFVLIAPTGSHGTSPGHGTAASSPLAGSVREIRAAVLSHDAGRLVRCFEAGQPVFVQVSPLGRGAFLGPGPLDALVRRLLAERVSLSFEVPDVPDAPPAGGRAFVTAVWTYRSSGSGTLHVDHLQLVLSHALEHAEWLIVEMKTSSR